MAKYESIGEVVIKSPHLDYAKNLVSAQNFIKRMTPKMPNGMRVEIKDSEHLFKSLLTFSYTPPTYEQKGRWAHAVCLHNSYPEVRKEVSRVWNVYARILAKPPLNALESIISENTTKGTPPPKQIDSSGFKLSSLVGVHKYPGNPAS